ncbi:MAG TPA: glycosyltransferase family 9 protein, partial [Isosphaeraceae bacterium]|nr:glycosyltransferase family 9 protein [Isosphaeraceae bacterium]
MSVRALDLVGSVLAWVWRRFVPVRPMEAPTRILFVQLDHLGDAVLSSPIFSRLRRAYPEARIEVLASLSNRSVFEIDPNIDEVLIAERNWFERRSGGWAIVSAVRSLSQRLRRRRYDLGIDVRGDVLS